MKDMTSYSAIVFYAKGWYKCRKDVEYVRKLMADWCLLPVECATTEMVSDWMLNILMEFDLIDSRFFDNIKPETWTYLCLNGPYDYHKAVIYAALSALSCMRIRDDDGNTIVKLDDSVCLREVLD